MTRKKISIVVPVLNAEAHLKRLISSVLAESGDEVEIIIVDGGSCDGSARIALDSGAKLMSAKPNRSLQRNLGVEAASADLLLFLDADMICSKGVIEECISKMETSPSIAALVIPEVSIGNNYWARVRAFERSFYVGIWWMEAARCFRRDAFEKAGGFDVSLLGGEDWDLDQRIREFGSVDRISSFIFHNEGSPRFLDLVMKKSHYADTLRLYAQSHPERAKLQLSMLERGQLFIRRPRRLFRHPLLSAGILMLGVYEWAVSRFYSLLPDKSPERPL